MQENLITRHMVPAAWVACLVLLVAGCTQPNQTGSNSPEVSPSSATGNPTASPSSTPSGSTSSPPVSTPPVGTPPAATPAGAALQVASLPFHSGEVGIAYAPVSFVASGGTPPYQWTISTGALPGGLSLTSGGQVSGTPSAAGHPSLTVMVTDSASHSASKTGTLTVYSALAVTQRCNTQLCSVEEGCTVCGAFGGVSGGLAPYHYKITNDNRPTGMGVSGLTLTGPFPAPGALGAFDLTVQVSDAFGAKRTVTAGWFVFSHIAFGVSAPTCVGYGCQVQLPYTMGTPNGVPVLTITNVKCPTLTSPPTCDGLSGDPPANRLPKGFSARLGSGVVTITFLSPGKYGNWIGSLNVVLTDQSLCGPGSARCSTVVTVTVDNETRFG